MIMFFLRWTLFQGIIIISLAVLAYIADLFKTEIAIPASSSMEVSGSMLMTFLFITAVIGLLSLLMYFQTKKSHTFLKHPLWDKMYVLMPVVFAVSFVLIFFLIDSVSDFIENHRWIIYIMIYYMLFLINIIVLSFIHKAKRNTIPNENKIMFSFVWTTLILFVIYFLL